MKRRKTINLNPFEHEALASLYLEYRIASDRYMQLPRELERLCRTFNAITGRNDNPGDILHYMQTKRRQNCAGKPKMWPTLDGTHRRIPLVIDANFHPDWIDTLRQLYTEIAVGAEAFVQDREIGAILKQRFFQETQIDLPVSILATALIELRKRKLLDHIGRRSDPDFGDFDQAEMLG